MKSEIEKDRQAREEIGEKISLPLHPVLVSSGSLVVGACQGACPLPFYTLWVSVVPPWGGLVLCMHSHSSHSLLKVLKMSWWAWGVGLGGLTSPPARLVAALHKHLTSLLTWQLRGREVGFASCYPASTGFHSSATVPSHDEEVPKAQCLI